MKILLKIKYPKLLIILITIIIAYFIFNKKDFLSFHELISYLGYTGTFLAGLFYAYGFTAAPATALLLIIAKEQNIFLATLIGGVGALLSDFLIFTYIRKSAGSEFKKMHKNKIVKFIEKEEKLVFGHYQKYVLAAFAGFLIASPLPTEIGTLLMAYSEKISLKKFLIIAYILHTFGIFIILNIGRLI